MARWELQQRRTQRKGRVYMASYDGGTHRAIRDDAVPEGEYYSMTNGVHGVRCGLYQPFSTGAVVSECQIAS